MVLFVVVCIVALLVIALITRIAEAIASPTWHSAAAERRQRWEARFADGGVRGAFRRER